MSNVTLRGTHRKYRIRNPYRLASGNRWLDKAKAAIHGQEPASTPETVKESLPVQQATPTYQTDCNDHPVEALHRIAAQAAAMTTLIEDAQKVRTLTNEEALSLKSCQSLTRKLSAVARSIEPLLPDAGENWTE